MINQESSCPCHSNKKYKDCCYAYHNGKPCENALVLMKSRYSAYSLMLTDYIIKTTHPLSPAFIHNKEEWKDMIESIYKNADFNGLKIDAFIEENDRAIVAFTAILNNNDSDVSFSEVSLFKKENNKWYYYQGKIFPGNMENLKSIANFNIFK
jgi:SEC-C motif-containing protein